MFLLNRTISLVKPQVKNGLNNATGITKRFTHGMKDIIKNSLKTPINNNPNKNLGYTIRRNYAVNYKIGILSKADTKGNTKEEIIINKHPVIQKQQCSCPTIFCMKTCTSHYTKIAHISHKSLSAKKQHEQNITIRPTPQNNSIHFYNEEKVLKEPIIEKPELNPILESQKTFIREHYPDTSYSPNVPTRIPSEIYVDKIDDF